MSWDDFLKNVRDGSLAVPIVGTYINAGITAALDDEEDVGKSGTGRAIENVFLKPGSKPIEKTMQGLNWAYDNVVSQPIATFLLMGKEARSSDSDPFAVSGDWFSASKWAKAWNTANHVSPGQAFWLNHSQGHDVLNARPVYANPGAAYLPAGFEDLPEDQQQELLRQAGMPVVGNEAIEKLKRDQAWFRFASGATDFAARWWVDPAVLGGKAAGAARQKYVVTPRPKGGWSASDIDSLMSQSRMAEVQRFLWENKDQPDLVNNLSMFKKSALGPRAGGIISTLKSPEEVNLFLRTTLGDAEARGTLQERNASAKLRMEQDNSRLSRLETAVLPRVQADANPAAAEMVQRRIDVLRALNDADEEMISRYNAALDHYGELDQLNLTRWSGSRAYTRTANQRNFRTGPALGTMSTRASDAKSVAIKAPTVKKARVYANDLFGSSFTLVRSFSEAHPNGLIAIDDIHPEAIDELRGQIARIPGIGPDIRADMLNRYLKTTTEGERMTALEEIQHLGVQKIAEKHGFTADEAQALYREYRANITRGQEDLRRYSGANFGDENRSVDIFSADEAGTRLKIHPNMVTKLANNQVLVDLDMLDKTLARHGSALKALRTSALGNPDWLINGMDHLSHLWKFATLFRLGYIPRVLSDDLLGQVARLGAATMAARTGYGVKNLATNLAHWRPASHYEAAEASARQGLKYADEEIQTLQPEADALRKQLDQRSAVYRADLGRARARATRAQTKLDTMDPAADPVKYRAMQQLVNRFNAHVQQAESRLNGHSPARRNRLAQLEDQLTELVGHRDLQQTAAETAKQARERGFRQSSQLNRSVTVGDGVVLPPALSGEKGEYYMKMISSDDQLRTMLARNKQLIHSNLQRSANTKAAAPISYPGHEKTFVEAWHKAINHQILQDPLAIQAVEGKTANEMAQWLRKTPEGRAYRKRLGIKYDTPERIAQSVWHEVDEYMPVESGVRDAALNSEADIAYLTELAKTGQYPQYVHSSQLGEALAGSNHASRAADRVIDWWYKWAASIPADRMSRHPLFNQLYEGHAKNLASQEIKQGVKLTQKDADRIAETARRLALKDTRRLVFDIAHRSDVGHALRFMSPFYSATTEAWQRWARILADRPQTVGYASIFFNAPISWGWMQDQDGNRVQRDGTAMVYDEKSGKMVRKLVPKGDRFIMARVPKFIASGPIGKIWGMDSSGNWKISQDSMNLVTQGDPWFNPGVGPVVSIPVNELVKDKPEQAELMRKLGILPLGPSAGGGVFGDGLPGRAINSAAPGYLKNFLAAWDTSDERYQRIKLQIMQQAAYEHANLGKPMPSAQEIANRTKNYWLWSAVTAFSQPFSTQKPDKYQFFRDQYNALRRKDPMTADEEYLKRFGESHFIFAQATSENQGGVPATMKAVELEKRYAGLIAKNPDLAALIVGPEGDGPFSPEAYTYQLTTPLIPGGAEMQRRKLTADEAMEENERRLGWAKFTQLSNQVTAELHNAGFESFEDEGAERFKEMRGAIAKLYGDPLLPDGSENPYYNEQWSKDYYSLDPKRYDRLIPGLTAVANSELAKLPSRSDLRRLQEYLRYRSAMTQELARRDQAGGSKELGAKSNADLAAGWARVVDALVESDTRFGDLYHRYLSRDMGVNTDELLTQEAA
ncbi:hypothetical protein AB0E62_00400 [Streptomyces sp. NPDC038707]|uniref:hypothetical protein n=1 Tax=Streptomyces sp. NPDC038707 TaxID=3154329 RepID=UPI0033D7282A